MGFAKIAAAGLAAASPLHADPDVPTHAENVLLHVIAHEIGHALIREFDLPILGPEEALADDFATVLINTMLPDRAEVIITDYATFLAADQTEASLFSEYNDDVKRGARAVCMTYGYAPDRHAALAAQFGLDGDLATACADSAPEVFRSWRRTLAPLMMPSTAPVTEVGLDFDDSDIAVFLADSEVMAIAEGLLQQFDWHSRITLSIRACDGSAGWSRNGRTITVCDSYIQRFAAAQ
ncbi:putative metallopeptidase DUF4344 [Yoonia maricola]|uniref:Putative metallopeptidase DUF4344 n=1 Tax=Yoonia maricola TaxID=420999 RepID=A0A2M8WP72_9RHOB|nr:DUF4344 domain-containing metallopeptidase [Yoonia maricola]PJI92737.1 putative metallopeptidase DUF4344 [Yoonia maricola]